VTADLPTTPSSAPFVPHDDPPPPAPLYSPKQIAVATLLATPVAGAVLAALNLRAVGKRAAALLVIVSAAALVATVVALDVRGYGALTLKITPLWTAAAFLVAQLAFARGTAHYGARKDGGVLAVVAAMWLAFALAGGGFAAWLHVNTPSVDEINDDAVIYAPHQIVRYVHGATRDDAARTARALAKLHYFGGDGSLTMTIERVQGRLRASVLVEPPVTAADADVAAKLTKHLSEELHECVAGQLVHIDGGVLARGASCPP
jgi:hypothetical protein